MQGLSQSLLCPSFSTDSLRSSLPLYKQLCCHFLSEEAWITDFYMFSGNSTALQEAGQITNICIVFGDKTGHGHPHSPQLQYDHGARHGFLVAAWTIDINIASGSIPGQSHQHGFSQQPGPQTLICPPVVAQTTDIHLGGKGLEHLPGLQWQPRPQIPTRILIFNMGQDSGSWTPTWPPGAQMSFKRVQYRQ